MSYQIRRKNYFRLVAFLYMILLVILCITRFMFINDILINFGVGDASGILSPNTTRQIRTTLLPSTYQFWDIQSNIAIFIPFGVITALIPKKPNLIFSSILSAAATIIIETMQYILANGVSDINDIVFNFIGGVLGFFIYYIIYLSNGKSKVRARDFIALVSLILPPFLIVYLYDMFILVGERYTFTFLDILYFAVYFFIVHILFLKDLNKKLIIFYYLSSFSILLYYIFIFMRV